jgi:hypothetical protein
MQPDFAVVTWRWKPKPDYRSKFPPETVNTLFRMIDRSLSIPYRKICVTDDPTGVDPSVEIIPLWNDFADLPSPHGERNPSCYRRLRMFSPEAAKWFGPRFVSLDLDCVVTGPLDPLWLRPEEFMIYGDTNPTSPYNGSMVLLKAGARPRVWTEFDPVESPKKATALGYYGSDQAWIGACLGLNERKWTRHDGVYSFRNEIGMYRQTLPAGCRLVIAHGQHSPWEPRMQALEWCHKAYR